MRCCGEDQDEVTKWLFQPNPTKYLDSTRVSLGRESWPGRKFFVLFIMELVLQILMLVLYKCFDILPI